MKVIAHIQTDFKTKFGAPRQSGLVKDALGKIVFESEYRDPNALRGLDRFSHIWVLWQFDGNDEDKWSPTVRPPKLGGNTRVGVFATRSPNRPNSIAMSALKIEKIEPTDSLGTVIYVSGCDMMDGTKILDIKPYLSYVDSIPDAKGGFTEDIQQKSLNVEFNNGLLEKVVEGKREALIEVLKSDPRPGYLSDPDRVYGFLFDEYEVGFKVIDGILTVIRVERK